MPASVVIFKSLSLNTLMIFFFSVQIAGRRGFGRRPSRHLYIGRLQSFLLFGKAGSVDTVRRTRIFPPHHMIPWLRRNN